MTGLVADTVTDAVAGDTAMGCSIADHLDWCRERNLRPATIAAREGILRRLDRFVGRGTMIGVTRGDLEEWAADLAARMTPAARAAELSHVCQFYAWCRRVGRCLDDPTDQLTRPRLPRRLPRPVSDAAVGQAIRAPDRVGHWFTFAAFAGLRAMEIAPLHRQDIDADHVFVADGKGGKQRVIPTHPRIRRVLDELPDRGYLFPALQGDRLHVSRTLISVVANKWLHDNGIPGTFHQFRAWFATATYAACRDLRVVQELLGHSSPRTTAQYVAWSRDVSADAVLAIDISR